MFINNSVNTSVILPLFKDKDLNTSIIKMNFTSWSEQNNSKLFSNETKKNEFLETTNQRNLTKLYFELNQAWIYLKENLFLFSSLIICLALIIFLIISFYCLKNKLDSRDG